MGEPRYKICADVQNYRISKDVLVVRLLSVCCVAWHSIDIVQQNEYLVAKDHQSGVMMENHIPFTM